MNFETTTLADVKVGDIIKIDDGKEVPADCVPVSYTHLTLPTTPYV